MEICERVGVMLVGVSNRNAEERDEERRYHHAAVSSFPRGTKIKIKL